GTGWLENFIIMKRQNLFSFGALAMILLSCSKDPLVSRLAWIEWAESNATTEDGRLLAFPGAEGFGRFATGARGATTPSVYFVTNLDDSGPGSFRDAVSEPGRFVLFNVSGIIKLKSNLAVAANTTIAGHTAPGDGVVLYGRKVSFSGSNVTIAHLVRIRIGANAGAGKSDDASGIANGKNIMLDHMSFTWGLDEAYSINWDNKGNEPDSITIQNSII